LQIERERLALEGRIGVDEGLVDFTRSDAPGLSDDVVVERRPAAGSAATEAQPATATTARTRQVDVDLRVELGEQLRVRGRGLDTGLHGELRLTAPGGRMAVNGTVSAVGGTYAAYGQKLEIDRGLLVFNGPAENPRLDIEATRPNLDVRVGVAVTGTAVNPRVRLFAEPEMSDLDKLSWLVLGRASDGLGRTDTALLQRAALALLSGEGRGPTDQLTQAIGLDEVSLRQNDGEVRETVISLGKQLSRRWYVGYERSLNATAGTWQLIYRIAQRFTLRAQSGEDSSLDVIWTWRWN
jgi:translocation and assembly module TamB